MYRHIWLIEYASPFGLILKRNTQYRLPIAEIHQPPIFGRGDFFDFGF